MLNTNQIYRFRKKKSLSVIESTFSHTERNVIKHPFSLKKTSSDKPLWLDSKQNGKKIEIKTSSAVRRRRSDVLKSQFIYFYLFGLGWVGFERTLTLSYNGKGEEIEVKCLCRLKVGGNVIP